MALEATLSVGIKAIQTKGLDLGKATLPITAETKIVLTDGTASHQGREIFSDTRTIAASASEEHDLAGGLVDAYGATITFATIKAIYIKAADTNTNDVIVGAAASNAFFGPFDAADNTVKVRPGGAMMLVAPKTGWTVTPSTADLLKIANGGSGTEVVYDIVIIGT